MTKFTLLTILGLVYIGVTRLASFLVSVLIVLFFGMSIRELIRMDRNRQGTTLPGS